jgi:hypothetical protein
MCFMRAVKAPCFQRLRLPRGAPLPFPPCIRHRALPLTAGDWQGAPPRVRARAPQRGAAATISGCALCLAPGGAAEGKGRAAELRLMAIWPLFSIILHPARAGGASRKRKGLCAGRPEGFAASKGSPTKKEQKKNMIWVRSDFVCSGFDRSYVIAPGFQAEGVIRLSCVSRQSG